MIIQAEKLIAEVRNLAAETPDYVYPGVDCSYIADEMGADEGNGCIVGQALQRLGVSREHLLKVEGSSIDNIIQEQLLDIDATAREKAWLYDVQVAQDAHQPWHFAIVRADRNNAGKD